MTSDDIINLKLDESNSLTVYLHGKINIYSNFCIQHIITINKLKCNIKGATITSWISYKKEVLIVRYDQLNFPHKTKC